MSSTWQMLRENPKATLTAVAFVVTTISGTLLGAGFKGQQQEKQKREHLATRSPADCLADLDQAKHSLVAKRQILEERVAKVRMRQEQNQE